MLWQRYRDELLGRIETEKSLLGKGAAASYEEYKARCGRIQGIEIAIKVLEDIISQTTKENRF